MSTKARSYLAVLELTEVDPLTTSAACRAVVDFLYNGALEGF